tara:strand:+ start:185 stop:313 length:129 start_codon:yes stop_codon:yes gene_type:complete
MVNALSGMNGESFPHLSQADQSKSRQYSVESLTEQQIEALDK